MDRIKLSIIIPAYNEEKNLRRGILDEVGNYLEQVNYSYEVIIVDDGSKDETVRLVKDFIQGRSGFKLLKNTHGGKALTVMAGLLAAKGEIALFADMDQATPIPEVGKFFPKFEEGYDLVIGSRHGRTGAPLIRKLAAWSFATLRNLTLGLPFKDTQCGFKAFNEKSRIEIFTQLRPQWEKMRSKRPSVNAGFDVEALFLAKKMGFKIAEVEVSWHYVGTKRVNLIWDSLAAIKDMLRIRWNDLTGKYDKK